MNYFYSISAASLALCLSCRSEPTITPDNPGAPLSAVQDGGDAPTVHKGCPSNLPGPAMVEVPAPDGRLYCIDSREVSQGEYFVFLAAFYKDTTGPFFGEVLPDAGSWPIAPGCEKNDRLIPSFGFSEVPCTRTPEAFCQQNCLPSMPVACVDWCDAYAYCAWAGKRLCGKIGGGELTKEEVTDPSKGEWFNACSQQGKTVYSYGDTYNPEYVTPENANQPSGTPATATGQPGCSGSIPPFDKVMSIGCNLAEWQGSTEIGPTGVAGTRIHLLAGTGTAPEVATRCDTVIGARIFQAEPYIGFRCCHD